MFPTNQISVSGLSASFYLLTWLISQASATDGHSSSTLPLDQSHRSHHVFGHHSAGHHTLSIHPPPSSSDVHHPVALSPVLCLLRGLSLEASRNQSRNYYECPGRRPPEYSECCSGNSCCVPNYVRQYLQEKASDLEKCIVLFSLSCLGLFLLYLCCLLPCCPFRGLCGGGGTQKTREYGGCTTKATEGPSYQTIVPSEFSSRAPSLGDASFNCGLVEESRPSMLLTHRGVQLSLASPPLPPPHLLQQQQAHAQSQGQNGGLGSSIAETSLMDGYSLGCEYGGSSASSSGCSSSHLVTIHAPSSRGSSPTTDSSFLSLITGSGGTPRSGSTVTTFSKAPVKSILKSNTANGHYNPQQGVRPAAYRDQRNSFASSVDCNGTVTAQCPLWRQEML